MSERMTIGDIARLAGVSKATVSRVLNHKPDVDQATRERILRILEEHHFVPSAAAVDLAGRKSRLIALVIPALTWPLIPPIIRGIAEIADERSYELMLYSINDSNHERDRSEIINRILANRLITGVLAIFPGQSVYQLPSLQKQGLPVVLLDDQVPPPESLAYVSVDNRAGAYAATRHLIELGHRRIAHIQGPLKYRVSRERLEGYREALAESDIPFDPALVLEGDFEPPSGRACAHRLFALPKRPTAIFAASDLMAYGVMVAAEERGLHVPTDLSLVGFDDLPSSKHMHPALTTVRQPLEEMGRCSFELLLSLLVSSAHPRSTPLGSTPLLAGYAGRATAVAPARATATLIADGPPQLILKTELMVRRSSAAPPLPSWLLF